MTQQKNDDPVRGAMLEAAAAAGLTEEQLDGIRDALGRGATLADVFGISRDALEAGYALAYKLHTAGNHKDAETMFRGLCMYDGTESRFWMGLGASLQAREAWEGAAMAYEMAAVQSALEDPTPLFHAGICRMRMGEAEAAEAAFQGALRLGDEANAAHRACHDRIRAMLAVLAETGGLRAAGGARS